MAKSKKKKNADFQKIKLKVGKKLSKGDNVTNLSFKTRQIQLTQTIRTGDSALPVTRKNLSIQDLLRQCDHHSVGARVNAVAGIKELLLNSFAEFLIPSNVHGYGAIMKKMCSLLIDNESDVRHPVINLFKLMFTKLKVESQTTGDNLMSGSLFSHIHAFLCCAMNHFHEDIRLDSLVLFDALLEAFPQAMVQQTGDLLNNLIGMISSPISIGTKANSVTQRLSMNPDSKLPVMKFRARVLLRIKRTLQVALLDITNIDANPQVREQGLDESVWSRFFDKYSEGAKQNTILVSDVHANKFSLILKGAVSDIQDYIIKLSSLETFIKFSIPVLLQCWKEARASGHNEATAGNMISSEALEVMSLVVSVIELMFFLAATVCSKTYGNQSQVPSFFFEENYEASFAQDFMNHFPYSAQILANPSKKKKLKGQAPTDIAPTQSSLTSLNLCVCHIMSFLCQDDTDTKQRPWLTKIQRYVIKCFNNSPSPEHNKLLTQILLNVFQSPTLLGQFVSAFGAACKYYVSCKVKHVQKLELFNLFSLVLSQWDGWKSTGEVNSGRYSYCEIMEGTISKFLKSLPQLLLQIPRDNPADLEWMKEILSCISSRLRGHGILNVQGEMSNCLTSVLGLLGVEDEDVQQKVLSLLSLGPVLNKDQLKQILQAIRGPTSKPTLPHRKSRSMASQAITCISLGIQRNVPFSSQVEFNQMTQTQSDCLSDYLKFMFSILIGMNREELENLCPVDNKISNLWKHVDYTLEKAQWDRHMDIATIVCQVLVNLQIPASPSDGYDQTFTFISNMEQLWKHTLAKYKNVHIMSAFSLFKFIYYCSLNHLPEKPTSEFYKMTATIMGCVLSSFYLPNSPSDKFSKEVIEQMKAEATACLCSVSSLLPLVCDILSHPDSLGISDNDEKQAAATALEFLKSDDQLKTRIFDENLMDCT